MECSHVPQPLDCSTVTECGPNQVWRIKIKTKTKTKVCCILIRNSKLPKGQTEIFKSEDRQDYGQQNEKKDKYRTRKTTLKTSAGETRTQQKPG